MTSVPPRFLDERASPIAVRLLDAGRDERPTHAATQRALTAVGIGAALGATTTLAGGASAPLVSGTAGSAVAKGALGSTMLAFAAKWVVVGAISGTVASTMVLELTSPAPEQRAPAPPPMGTAVHRPMPRALATAVASEQHAPLGLSESRQPASAASRPEIAANRSDPPSPLSLEISRVDRARRAFQAHDFAGALGILADYEREFPDPRLYQEVLLLRMESERQLGHLDRAAVLARHLISDYPQGPHAVRAQELLDGSNRKNEKE